MPLTKPISPKKLTPHRRALLIASTAGTLGVGLMGVEAKPKKKSSGSLHQAGFRWEFRQVGDKGWMKASVPGTVHTDLLAAKKIEDPFYRLNERDQQWIDKKDWEYRTTITLDQKQISEENIELHFEGLDTYCDVYVNDVKLLSADNMFREWVVNIKPHARLGKNELRIHFHSPIEKGLKALETFGFAIPSPNDQSEVGGLGDKKVGLFTRKAGYHYGWDWGPRFVTSGIWRPVHLRTWSKARIQDLTIVQKKIDQHTAEITAVFEIMASRAGPAKLDLTVIAKNPLKVEKTVELSVGLNKIDVPLSIPKPQLWWSNGLGKAHLYTIKGRVTTDGAQDSRTVRTGLRTIKLVQKPDQWGTSFEIELNGVSVFMKGANYIPNDIFLPRVTSKIYERVVQSAVDTHMNMLRVWGGGVYEDDRFYDLCDQKGILVWQDFMFACSMLPDDQAFLDNVKQEAIDNVKRLRNHACIALWCGNNEIDSAWKWDEPNGGWGWKKPLTQAQQDRLTGAYNAIFHEILPNAVKDHDQESRFYWPSSPIAAWDGKNGVVHDDLKREKQAGDIHYWGVWWGQAPFSDYRTQIGRFMSEYGFQSFPEFKTVEAYTVPSDHDIFSEVMKAHQRSSIGNGTIKNYMERDYVVPKDFRHLLYVGQVLQAEGIKVAMEAHRVRMPFCMGSLFWQINDCWPVASWSSIDYYGRWKAQQFFARHAFAPVLVSGVLDKDLVTISAVNDHLSDIPAKLSITVMDFSGKVKTKSDQAVTLKANHAAVVFSGSAKALLKDCAENEALLHVSLSRDGALLSENILYFKPVKELKLPSVTVSPLIKSLPNGEFALGLSAPKLVKNLFLSLKKHDGVFSDNYIDLLPGKTRIITLKPNGKLSEKELLKDLSLLHIKDTIV